MSTKKIVRRYYYANTLAAVVRTLGIPERTHPQQDRLLDVSAAGIASIFERIAHMDVHNEEDALRARIWIVRILRGMESLGYWNQQQCDALLAKDHTEHFHLPVTA